MSPTPSAPPEYESVREIGRGSFGVVVLARHRVLGRLVAVKQIAASALLDPDAVARFSREARALAAARHPNVVEVYDLCESGGRWFMVMEYVAGPTLRTWLHDSDVARADRLAVVAGLADALSTAHARGVLHRDVKPGNVLLTTEGQAKLADFGLARLSDPTAFRTALPGVAGTRGYLAPELLAGHPPDRRTDTYAFAVLAVETLTGRRPDSTQWPGSAGAPEAAVLCAALDPEPDQRPTMLEVSRTLASAAGPSVKTPQSRARRVPPVVGDTHPAPFPHSGFDDATDAQGPPEPSTTATPHHGASSSPQALSGSTTDQNDPAPGAADLLPPIFDPGPPPRSRKVGRTAAGVAVGLGVAAVTAALVAATAKAPDLVVTSVSTSVAPPVGECPEATFVLTAEVETNGGAGRIVTRWLQPDGRASDPDAQQLDEGQTRLAATLTYVHAGQEPMDALARFEVLSPNTVSSPVVPVRYEC